jgi:hypothetical protein
MMRKQRAILCAKDNKTFFENVLNIPPSGGKA